MQCANQARSDFIESAVFQKGVIYQMKKNLTKLLALMMALALVFSLAACGGDNGDENSTDPSNNPAANDSVDNDDTVPPADDTDPSATNEDPSATDESGTTPNEEVTTPGGDKVTTPEGKPETKPANTDKGLTSNDKAAVIKFYQAAARKTGNKSKQQNLSLKGKITGDGAVAKLVGLASGAVDSALSSNSSSSEGVPGAYDQLVASDLVSASAKSNGKTTTINMTAKEQTDSAKSTWDKGPVGHAIGVLGDVDQAIKELEKQNLKVDYSGGVIKLTYKSPKVTVVVDNATGKITSATWSYDVAVHAEKVKVSYSFLSITVQSIDATINNTIKM